MRTWLATYPAEGTGRIHLGLTADRIVCHPVVCR
jgi:hypothetical protein